MALDIKKFLKGLRILNDSDTTKALELNAGGSTSTKTTVVSSQTVNRTVTLPDATDTLVGKATTDTLTNKTFDADGTGNSITNIENADIKSGAAIDATKIHDGSVDNTEFGYLNGVTSAIQTQLNGKEIASNKGIANGYASLDANGLVPTTQMPPAALERMVVVADQTARFALTTTTVQNGDTVYQTDTSTMYMVKDDTNLNNSSGYQAYSAGTSVNFTGSLAGDITGTQGATTYNGTVPIAKGGTNSTTALSGNKAIVSNGTQIVESSVTSTELGLLSGKTGVLVTEAGTQTLTNKTLTTPSTDVVTLDGQASTPASPSAGNYKAYVKDSTQKLTILDSNGVETTVGSGSSGVNYIAANDGTNIGAWVTYADAAGSSPVDGTGGSPNVIYAVSTSTALRGPSNFLFTHDAANRQGQGFSYDFTIDPSDKGKVLQLSFEYLIASGTYADDDMTFWIYDVTNTTLIQPAPYKLKNSGIIEKMAMEFQTSSSSTSYRLIGHVATSTATAYTIRFDNWNLGPQAKLYGSTITDPVAYTPTFTGFGSPTNVNFKSWRAGKYLFVEGTFTNGTPTATEGRITLGFNGTSGNVTSASTLTTLSLAGEWADTTASSTTDFRHRRVLVEASKTYFTFGVENSGGSGSLVKQNGNGISVASATISIFARVEIEGWSSSVVMSSDADTRVVAGYFGSQTSTSITTSTFTKINFTKVISDTHGAYSTSNSQYTIPVAGYYKVSALVEDLPVANAGNILSVYKNSTEVVRIYRFDSAGASDKASYASGITPPILLAAGDVIEIRAFQSSGSTVTVNSGATDRSANFYWGIDRLSGPAQIAASETITARYGVASSQTPGTNNPIDFATKVFDSHNAVTTGSSWKFTAPISGVYGISVVMTTLTGNPNIYVYIDGVQAGGLFTIITATSSQSGMILQRVLAGQTIDIRMDANVSTGGNTALNAVNIWKAGNY